VSGRTACPPRFTLIPAIDTWPGMVAFAQTVAGKLTVLAVFALGLWLHEKPWWLDATVLLAIMTFLPQHRRVLLLVATFYWLAKYTLFDWMEVRHVIQVMGTAADIDLLALKPTILAAIFIFCGLFYHAACHFQHHPLMRRPVLSLFVVYFAVMLTTIYGPLTDVQRTYLWVFIIIFGRYIWFLAYSLLDRRNVATDGFVWQLRSYLPFWIGLSTSPAPIAKGAANLRKIEARTPEQLAVCQLKGIKLVFWAYILMVVETVFANVVHGQPGYLDRYFFIPYSFDLPLYKEAFYGAIAGDFNPWYSNWLSLVAQLFHNVLYLAIWGHVIIATCRMAGFNALRGTYKPLAAKTLAEFWNRYFYYFKELLVEFFFYPTYLRYFKKYPRFRLFFATLMAAGAGNVLFHFIRDPEYIIDLGFFGALWAFHVYMFYGMVLGSAIGLSQLRNRRRKQPRGWFHDRIGAPAVVILFYCIVLIFDDPDRSLTLKDNFVFVLSLFNIQLP
jgi:hypothetical protein